MNTLLQLTFIILILRSIQNTIPSKRWDLKDPKEISCEDVVQNIFGEKYKCKQPSLKYKQNFRQDSPINFFYQKKAKALGFGAFSSTYLIEENQQNEFSNQNYVLKISKKQPSIKNEIQTLLKINQELSLLPQENIYVIKLIDFEELINTENNLIFEILEYGDLGNFETIIDSNDYSFIYKLRVFSYIIQGVQQIHHCGFSHGDLKADNVVLTSYHIPKIIDFQLAKSIKIIDQQKMEENQENEQINPNYSNKDQNISNQVNEQQFFTYNKKNRKLGIQSANNQNKRNQKIKNKEKKNQVAANSKDFNTVKNSKQNTSNKILERSQTIKTRQSIKSRIFQQNNDPKINIQQDIHQLELILRNILLNYNILNLNQDYDITLKQDNILIDNEAYSLLKEITDDYNLRIGEKNVNCQQMLEKISLAQKLIKVNRNV